MLIILCEPWSFYGQAYFKATYVQKTFCSVLRFPGFGQISLAYTMKTTICITISKMFKTFLDPGKTDCKCHFRPDAFLDFVPATYVSSSLV